MKKFNEFDYSYLIRDKTRNINTYCKFMLCKSQGMFIYEGLPETLPSSELERILQTTGNVTIAKHDGDIYAFSGQLKGEHLSVYHKPTQSLVTNIALNLTKEYEDNKDCVIGYNDSYGLGVAPIYAKYGFMLCENRITQYNILILTRSQQLFSASDNNTVASANTYIKKLMDGELSVIAENAFFDGLKTHNDNASIASNLKTLIEYEQYIKASCLNEIGLNANFNMKREALNSSETGMNEDALLPFPIDMLNNRIEFVERVNKLFGTSITVKLNELWGKDECVTNDNQSDGNNQPDESTSEQFEESNQPEIQQNEQVEVTTENIEKGEVNNGQNNDDDVSKGND